MSWQASDLSVQIRLVRANPETPLKGKKHMKEVPIWEKSNLTIEEAAAYFNIGENKLRKLAADESCPFVLWVGSKCLIKKACFEEYLRKRYSI